MCCCNAAADALMPDSGVSSSIFGILVLCFLDFGHGSVLPLRRFFGTSDSVRFLAGPTDGCISISLHGCCWVVLGILAEKKNVNIMKRDPI